MFTHSLWQLIRCRFGSSCRRRWAVAQRARLMIESFERRMLPSTFTVVNLGDTGAGSGAQGDLRYAINQANTNVDLSNRIVFQPGLTGTITLTLGVLPINKNLAIEGPGAGQLTISGNQQSGVIDITSDPRANDVHISDLTIAGGTGGFYFSGDPQLYGGGLFNDHAAVTLTGVTVSGNSAPSVAGQGGGIYNGFYGTMVLDSCVISANTSGFSNSVGVGGGIENQGSLTMRNSLITGNTSWDGSAIISGSILATLTLEHSTLTDNRAYNRGTLEDGSRLTITDSTIEGNDGFGVGHVGLRSATITDTTIANNTAGVGNGGGATMTITGSTVAGNMGAGITSLIGDINVTNSTISGNSSRRYGGGVVLLDVRSSVELTGCTITGNAANGEQFNWGAEASGCARPPRTAPVRLCGTRLSPAIARWWPVRTSSGR